MTVDDIEINDSEIIKILEPEEQALPVDYIGYLLRLYYSDYE